MHEEIISKIKEKKFLDRLDDAFIKCYLDEFFQKNNKLKVKFENNTLKKSEIKIIVKGVRNELNIIYGQFWNTNKELKIEMHKSTKERLSIYNNLYKKIFDITGKPQTILDLGAGLNPLSYELIGKDVFYFVNELTKKDCEEISKYLIKNKFKFEILEGDINKIKEFPKVDVCFMFKLLDSLDVKGHKISEELIKKINVRSIVVSFSNVTTRNRKMNYPKRGWFEVMVKRLDYKFKKLEFGNETFYILNK